MRIATFIPAALLACVLAAGPLISLDKEVIHSSLGATIELVARHYQPGEIILAVLNGHQAVRKAGILFLDKNYEVNVGEAGVPFILLGIDLGVSPGVYGLKITLEGKGGEREELNRSIPVMERKFPAKRLWVKEEFVEPPAEVQERIKREAELLKNIYGRYTPSWLGQGSFRPPHQGAIAPNFGERRIYNNVPRSTHSGVDIAAPMGSPIKASNSGRVVLAYHLYYAGKTVIIDHGLGLFTFYCHFSKINVKDGDFVNKGDVVGLAGSTGRSTGPHLHWGVKVLDSRVDPLALLSLPFTSSK